MERSGIIPEKGANLLLILITQKSQTLYSAAGFFSCRICRQRAKLATSQITPIFSRNDSYLKAFYVFAFSGKIADLNYAVYSNLGIFLHTIWHNLSLKVTPSPQYSLVFVAEDY